MGRGGRGRGWAGVAGLALAVMAFSVLHPALLIFLPLSLLLITLPPRRPGLVALGAAFLVLAVLGPRDGPVWYVERGWALVLGAWFLALAVLRPAVGFFPRALGALGATLASVALVLSISGGWSRLDWTIARHLKDGAAMTASLLGAAAPDGFAAAVYDAAELHALIYPALLGLASLAGLGIAWWAYRRLAAGEERPLAPLREFRFPDDLVWLLIGGLLLVLLPLGDAAVRAGTNVLTFMGALYALRGVAVLLVFGGALGPAGATAAAVAAVLLYPLLIAASLFLGLTDTWMDLRSRRAAAVRTDGPGS